MRKEYQFALLVAAAIVVVYSLNRSSDESNFSSGGVRHDVQGTATRERSNSAAAAVAAAAAAADECDWMKPLSATFRKARVPSTVARRNVVYFTDGSVFDDVVTLFYLVKVAGVNVLAVYVQGNGWANLGPSIKNLRSVLHMMSDEWRDVPIMGGSYFALIDQLQAATHPNGGIPKSSYRWTVIPGPTGLLGSDTMLGLARNLPQPRSGYNPYSTPVDDDASLRALLRVVDTTLGEGERLTLLSTGTLTPIAKLFSDVLHAEVAAAARTVILPRVDALFVMGGAVFSQGNIYTIPENTRGELNIFLDPHAADWAFANLSRASIPVTLVPLDATNDVPITRALLHELLIEPRTPEAQLVGRLMSRLRDIWGGDDGDAFFQTAYLWDVSAAIVMTNPATVRHSRQIPLRVVTEEGPLGANQGWTKPCSQEEVTANLCSPITVIEDLFPDRVVDTLLTALQNPTHSAQRSPICRA